MDDVNEVGEQIVKKKKPRGGNNFLTDAALKTDPGDNAKYLKVSMQLMKLPEIDLHDPEQVQERLEQFFAIHAENDMKPTVAGMGLALNGMDRRRLWEIKTGSLIGGVGELHLPSATMDSIKKAYRIMENLWENYMQNGKINPVSGIFLGKNNYGYKDQSEYVLTPNNPMGEQKDPDEIAKRYALEVGSDYEPEE